MKRPSIRWRLTLWYGAVLSAILFCSDVATYFLLRHYLLVLTDAALQEELTELADEVGRANGLRELAAELGVRFASHEGYEFQVSVPKGGGRVFRSDGLGPGMMPLPQAPGPGPYL